MIFSFNHIDDNYYIYIVYMVKLILPHLIYPRICGIQDYWRMTSFVQNIV